MNIASFIQDFKDTQWKHLLIEGSPLGNTSFLIHFMKNILIGDEAFESQKLDRLLGEQPNILYIRPMEVNKADKVALTELTSVALIEYIANEDVFDYRNLLRYIQNRSYTYLIIDDARQKYENNRFEKFSEIISHCENTRTKIITSVTDNRYQKMDYQYGQADLLFDVSSYLAEKVYVVSVENKNKGKISNYTIPMK